MAFTFGDTFQPTQSATSPTSFNLGQFQSMFGPSSGTSAYGANWSGAASMDPSKMLPTTISPNANSSMVQGTFGSTPDIHANTTYMPGLGYIPNSNIQSDSRGSWIGAGPGMGTSASPSSAGSGGYSMPTNPYLGGQAADITNRTNQFMQDALNGIQSDAVGNGGIGGSRQGVAQGIALGRAGDYLSGNLANLYGSNYNQEQNRDLQRYGINTNAGLQQYLGDQSFYTAQRGQDLSQLGLAGSLYGLGSQGMWAPYQNYANLLGNFTGFGNTNGSTQQGGGGLGAAGGALGGYTLWNYLMGQGKGGS